MTEILTVSQILLWVMSVTIAVLLLATMRQVGSLLLRVGPVSAMDAGVGPSIGDPAPWVPPNADLYAGEDRQMLTLIAFLSTGCGACEELVPALNAVAESYQDSVTVVAVGREDEEDLGTFSRRQTLHSPLISAPAAFDAYEVSGTPYAFVLGPDRTVAARGGVNHIEHIESLLRKCGLRQDRSSLGTASAQGGSG